MNEITLIRINSSDRESTLAADVDEMKTLTEPSIIGNVNWPDYPYRPKALVYTGWSSNGILLHYDLVERSIGAACLETNGPVYRDSCVEFFISDGTGGYFNFEFNALGTRYAGHGSSREDSTPLPVEAVERIVCEAKLSGRHKGISERDTAWILSALIPFELMADYPLGNPAGEVFAGNFYKCAEETGAPHFLSWNPIKTDSPDFHRPEYFGKIRFTENEAVE